MSHVPTNAMTEHYRLLTSSFPPYIGLREHLLAAGAGQPTAPVTPVHQGHGIGVGHQDHHIDPAISGSAGYGMSPDDDGHLSSEGRKGRRELSTSKRAAQNRAAQRAFRQRKEEYIKSLKDQVKEYETLAETYKAVQQENYQLRDYIISLQSKLLESQGTVPPPPDNVDLSRPNAALESIQHSAPSEPSAPPPSTAPTATMTPVAINQLQQAAAQASAHDVNNNGTPYDFSSSSLFRLAQGMTPA
ncbi:hypothetical protein EJ05DRAFT_473769 [Pseudovirgaria hyperparasitica]|uniref:Putative transcription factor kapC n=1 Tax=Pseudovirgaria hyperparasitica TaxID=470096 RepID=A0A6A6WEI6_9PEZI|nr:uncharacterized protein EJ05DRAFT_473769 [Pseudovirgaria hyperparasitica]KAF2761232.1 hypothetical protein EJ05DRAFT_473769 [Pseudovirgaria hyperparasitica]